MDPRAPRSLREFLRLPEAERQLGPYRLLHPLGRGGYAPVWLAAEAYGGRDVRMAAVKLFEVVRGLGDGTDEAAGEEIVMEARALCRVEHPSIVRFYSLPADESRGILGLAMEYVQGESIAQALEKQGCLPLNDVLAIGAAVASALEAVHRAGLVHRDVKPGNIMAAAGSFKLVDFGVALPDAWTPSRERRSPDGPPVAVMDDLPIAVEDPRPSPVARSKASSRSARDPMRGTTGYVDPVCVVEHVRAVPASDLYALGAVLFEAVTGKVPAAAGRKPGDGLDSRVLDGEVAPPSVSDLVPDLPRAFVKLVDALLHPSRSRRPRTAGMVAQELERLRLGQRWSNADLPPEEEGPFRGLGRYEAADRFVLFGRGADTATALERLRANALVTLVGPSGSGKSSLARAGILPAVVDGALAAWPKAWDVHVVTPGRDPHGALVRALGDAHTSPDTVAAALEERAYASGRGTLLFVDQLEELVTIADPGSAEWAARLLAQLGAQALPGVRVLVTVRRDLLDEVLALPEIGSSLIRGAVFVAPLADQVWAEVVDSALAAYGYRFEDKGLRREVLDGLRGIGMPLVQFALTRLWKHRDTKTRRVTRSVVVAMGGIAGALERHADETLAQLRAENPGAMAVVRSVLLALTTPQGTRATKTRAELQVIAAHPFAVRVLEVLEQARLIVAEVDGLSLAHDTLLAQWTVLAAWLDETRQDRVLCEEIERDARRWRASGHDTTLLWRRHRLAAAEDLLRRSAAVLSPDARDLILHGRRAERRGRIAALGLAGVIGILVTTTAMAVVVGVSRARNAKRQEEVLQRQSIANDQKALHFEQAWKQCGANQFEDYLKCTTALQSCQRKRGDYLDCSTALQSCSKERETCRIEASHWRSAEKPRALVDPAPPLPTATNTASVPPPPPRRSCPHCSSDDLDCHIRCAAGG